MKILNHFLCVLLLFMVTGVSVRAQSLPRKDTSTLVTFKFVPGQDMFFVPYGGNDTELNRLYSLIEEYRTEITGGTMPVRVDGYCASGENIETGFKTAVIRSNRVKSELITHKGLVEEHFITKNHTTAYTAPDGTSYPDMVVVTLRIPVRTQVQDDTAEQQRLAREREAAERERREQAERERAEKERAEQQAREQAERERAEREARQAQSVIPEPAAPLKPYCFAVRTNLLYDAFLTPTLGAEWRVNRNIGIKVDGSYAFWGNEHSKVQKIWLVSPEVRWYLLDKKRFYVGLGGNVGKYNIYKGMLGGLFSGDTGYQGKLYGGGLTVGYQLYLSRSFSLDFNLGLGYTRLEYDSFTISNQTRIFKDRDKTRDFWGPTQAGISLVWTIGNRVHP